MKENGDEDLKLIRKILSGDKKSEIELYEKYRKILKFFLIKKQTKILSEDIDDIITEILTKIFISLNSYDSNKSLFKTWVFNIATNYLYDKYRYEKNKKTISIENNIFTEYNTTCIASDIVNEFENNSFINYISENLSDEDFNMINMKYNLGYNYAEIGKIYNYSSSTVSNKVNYIKTKIKKIIDIDI